MLQTKDCNRTIHGAHEESSYRSLTRYIWDRTGGLYEYYRDNSEKLAVLLFIYVVVCVVLFKFLLKHNFLMKSHKIQKCKNVLFVTAHPDDECMFFGPSIVSLTADPTVNVSLLCLSRGDYESLGRVRKEELWQSCELLGIPASNVQLLHLNAFPDNPKVRWSSEHVANVLQGFIEQLSIDTVITFDRFGVSYHMNHISVFYGVAYLLLVKNLPKNVNIYVLESVSLLRKYSLCVDAALSWALSPTMYLAWGEQKQQIQQSMQAHHSQYVWFRRLYMLCSRYTCINTLRRVEAADVELELDLDDEPN